MIMKTTFWSDFSIADHFGIGAVQDTYERALEYAMTDVQYYAELVIVLNHKIWEHYDKGNMKMSKLYDKLWRKADGKAYKIFTTREERCTYFQMTD